MKKTYLALSLLFLSSAPAFANGASFTCQAVISDSAQEGGLAGLGDDGKVIVVDEAAIEAANEQSEVLLESKELKLSILFEAESVNLIVYDKRRSAEELDQVATISSADRNASTNSSIGLMFTDGKVMAYGECKPN